MNNKTETICIRLPKGWVEYLKELSRTISYKEKKDTHYHELIRQSIKEKFGGIDELPKH
jgi:hypothetical protein